MPPPIKATFSPYARKVQIAVAEKGLPDPMESNACWSAAPAPVEENPLHKLPILLLEDASSATVSRLLVQHLETQYPHPPLLPRSEADRLAALAVEVLADTLCDSFIRLFWGRHGLGQHCSDQWVERQQTKVDGGLAALARVAGDRTFVVGNHFGLADIATGTVVRYLDLCDDGLVLQERYPNQAALSERLEQRDSFRRSRPTV